MRALAKSDAPLRSPLNENKGMTMKILSVFLCCVCVIGCASYSDDDEGVRGTFLSDSADTERQTAPVDDVGVPVENPDECPPDLQGEPITGKLNTGYSEKQILVVNENRLQYYYTLNLELNDSTVINIVFEEAFLNASWKVGGERDARRQIHDGDLLLVKLDHVLEPGVWKGTLVKNITQNRSF